MAQVQPSGDAGAEPPPALRALKLIEHCLDRAKKEKSLLDFVMIDLRAIVVLRAKLEKNPGEPDSLKWLRQLAIVWSTRLSGLEILAFRDVFRLLEKCPPYQR
jgi:hypothetical protein